jgi:hypothetical protein
MPIAASLVGEVPASTRQLATPVAQRLQFAAESLCIPAQLRGRSGVRGHDHALRDVRSSSARARPGGLWPERRRVPGARHRSSCSATRAARRTSVGAATPSRGRRSVVGEIRAPVHTTDDADRCCPVLEVHTVISGRCAGRCRLLARESQPRAQVSASMSKHPAGAAEGPR